MSAKTLFVLAACLGALAVVFGAFGAHALKQRLSEDALRTFETGNRYHWYHCFALFICAWLASTGVSSPSLNFAAWGFALGMILFSGSLYVLAISGIRWLGAITPIGGSFWVLAWLALAAAAYQGKP